MSVMNTLTVGTSLSSAAAAVGRWTRCWCCVPRATVAFSCLLMVLSPLLLPASANNVTSDPAVKCMLGNNTSCPTHHCCVKKVILFRDPQKAAIVRTECQPLLGEGEMCLRNPEDYMCPCLPGMRCDWTKRDTMGHCVVNRIKN